MQMIEHILKMLLIHSWLKCEFAYGKYFQALRKASTAQGLDLRREFTTQLMAEQTRSYELAHDRYQPDSSKLLEWYRISFDEHRMRMPFLYGIRFWLRKQQRNLRRYLDRYLRRLSSAGFTGDSISGEDGVMNTSKKYSLEVRESEVRLVLKHQGLSTSSSGQQTVRS